MLARGGELPRGAYGFEVKWDGFRAVVATGPAFRVRSRRGWDMTPLLPELRAMPDGLVLDGELVALAADGRPDQPRLCRRILHGDDAIPVVYLIFDVLAIDGEDVKVLGYRERRELLDELE